MIDITQIAHTAILKIIDEEGGWRYTDHPKDKDRGTYAGVRYKVFAAYYLNNNPGKEMSPAIFKDLAERGVINDMIIDIYYQKYYKRMQIDFILDNMKMPLFSAGVNMGVRRGVMLLQKTINKIADTSVIRDNDENIILLKVDGICGTKTCTAMGTVYFSPLYIDISLMDPLEVQTKLAVKLRAKDFRNTFVKNWCRRYVNITIDNPEDNIVFLNGWFNRAEKYWVF